MISLVVMSVIVLYVRPVTSDLPRHFGALLTPAHEVLFQQRRESGARELLDACQSLVTRQGKAEGGYARITMAQSQVDTA